jgi:hypothetical protein
LQVPSSFVIYQPSNWAALDQNLQKDPNFGLVLMKAWEYKPLLDYALNNAGTEELQKIKAIYDYVKNNFEWNERYSIFTSADLSEISKIKKGNSADINFMLMYLLQKAGLQTYPVLIKTVDNGHLIQDMAAALQFNNVIVAVESNGKKYLLDATNKEIPWYLLDKNDLNLQGRIIKNVNSDFIDIQPNKKTYSQVQVTVSLQSDVAQCSINQKDFGYFAQEKRSSPQKFTNEFKNKFTNINDFDYSYKFLRDDNEPLELAMSFATSDIIEGNKIYPFDLFLFDDFYVNPKRKHSVYFGFASDKMYMITLQVP